MPEEKRVDFDLESSVERVLGGPCFVCGIVSGDPRFPAHVVYRDERDTAFLPNFHVLLGYVLLAPLEHREAVVGDFSIDQYLALQGVVLSRSSGRHRDGPQGKGRVGHSSPRSSCRRQRDR
ncbi:MAG: hypothetical protein M3N51_01295 [Actinomycetota bacterium]|nr:hypothetical protein [Actinomycetota bacterium]